ncbi:MAG TPA: glucose-6-phosphate dehydrogenase, partial [Gaiellales bacterium]|nr:glucose-6-phosphate dehydrogenase [Gaiellales bacterium]
MSPRKTPETNPLREGLRVGGASEPALFTIFGATGDLAQRKLLPALYNLAKRGLLPPRFGVVGYARTEFGEDGFRRFAKAAIDAHSRTEMDERFWPAFASMLHYHAGGFDDTSHFHALAKTVGALNADLGGDAHRIFYLSTPSSFFPVIVRGLGAAKLSKPSNLVRVV